MSTRGRISKISDPETTRRLLESLEMGLDYKTAAEYAGVGQRTERDWRVRGLAALEAGSKRKSDRPYIAYYEATLAARAKGQFDTAKLIQQAGHTGFKAITTRIEQVMMNGTVVSEKVITEERDVPPDWRAALVAGTHRFGWKAAGSGDGNAEDPEASGGGAVFIGLPASAMNEAAADTVIKNLYAALYSDEAAADVEFEE